MEMTRNLTETARMEINVHQETWRVLIYENFFLCNKSLLNQFAFMYNLIQKFSSIKQISFYDDSCSNMQQ